MLKWICNIIWSMQICKCIFSAKVWPLNIANHSRFFLQAASWHRIPFQHSSSMGVGFLIRRSRIQKTQTHTTPPYPHPATRFSRVLNYIIFFTQFFSSQFFDAFYGIKMLLFDLAVWQPAKTQTGLFWKSEPSNSKNKFFKKKIQFFDDIFDINFSFQYCFWQ